MSKCPKCGSNGQLLFSSFECTKPSCDNFVQNEDEIERHIFDHVFFNHMRYNTSPILYEFTNVGIAHFISKHEMFGPYVEMLVIESLVGAGIVNLYIHMEYYPQSMSLKDIEEIFAVYLEEIRPATIQINIIMNISS